MQSIPPGTRWGLLEYVERANGSRIRCRCDCGGETVVTLGKLTTGHTKSCGCLRRRIGADAARFSHGHTTHGGKRSPTHQSWSGMLDRCTRATHAQWKDYGGRGIKVCERWLDFKNFLADMGARPDGTSMDRIDNDGHYEPCNCRWATRAEQARNTRINDMAEVDGRMLCLADAAATLGVSRYHVKRLQRQGITLRTDDPAALAVDARVRLLQFNGETMSTADWAKRIGICRTTLYARLKRGWSVERVLTNRHGHLTSP